MSHTSYIYDATHDIHMLANSAAFGFNFFFFFLLNNQHYFGTSKFKQMEKHKLV